jgi:hypothetical protein
MSDASAVVALDAHHFAVADDEDNVLRIYSRLNGGLPIRSVDLSTFLAVDPRWPEVDLEDAARVGDRVYWISSHGRNKKGIERVSRYRFFATSVVEGESIVDLEPTGRPYLGLLEDLLKDPNFGKFGLSSAAQRAPKARGALNIEGLCAMPDGRLLLGFRNPIPDGKALVVPLENPKDVIAGQTAKFGAPILLDLGGWGISGMTATSGKYVIAARSYDGEGQSLLYEWEGGADKPRQIKHSDLLTLNPEGLAVFPETSGERLFIVSDDGTLKVGRKKTKRLKNPNQKRFRAITIGL